MRSDIDGLLSGFQFIQNMLNGVKVRDLCSPVKFVHTKLGKKSVHFCSHIYIYIDI